MQYTHPPLTRLSLSDLYALLQPVTLSPGSASVIGVTLPLYPPHHLRTRLGVPMRAHPRACTSRKSDRPGRRCRPLPKRPRLHQWIHGADESAKSNNRGAERAYLVCVYLGEVFIGEESRIPSRHIATSLSQYPATPPDAAPDSPPSDFIVLRCFVFLGQRREAVTSLHRWRHSPGSARRPRSSWPGHD